MTKALQEHRHRLIQRGLQRVEVAVPTDDADLVRRVARILASDDQAAQRLRAALQGAAPGRQRVSFKDWLAAD